MAPGLATPDAENAQTGGERPMKDITKKIQSFLVSEDGPTAVEYAVMLGLIIVVAITAITSIGTALNGTFTNVEAAMP
jgi:pilus assembly protein Flp/PilA